MEKTYALVKDSVVINTIIVEEDNIDMLNLIKEINENPEMVEIPLEKIVEVNYVYDEAKNAFIPPKPYPSWTLDESTFLWLPPIPMPEQYTENPIYYVWDEETINWREDNGN